MLKAFFFFFLYEKGMWLLLNKELAAETGAE